MKNEIRDRDSRSADDRSSSRYDVPDPWLGYRHLDASLQTVFQGRKSIENRFWFSSKLGIVSGLDDFSALWSTLGKVAIFAVAKAKRGNGNVRKEPRV